MTIFKTHKIAYLLLFLSIGANIGFLKWCLNHINEDRSQEEKNTAENRIKYPFLSQRIFVEDKNDVFIGFMPLRKELNKYIDENGKEKIGFYFEYLPSGSSIGVNEKVEFPLASLFKLPAIIGTYEMIEQGKLTKDTKLTIEEKHIDKDFGNLWEKGVGTQLSVSELIDYTLKESDNTAVQVLYDQMPNAQKADLFEDLDVSTNQVEDGYIYAIGTAKSYSSILRSLYLSTFLTEEHSNEILDILTKTKFNDMLPAGLPNNIKVAHKIGEYQRKDTGGFVHSDCGIIFVPKRPYILCMMVQGDKTEAIKHISFLSKMVYGYISQANLRPSTNGF